MDRGAERRVVMRSKKMNKPKKWKNNDEKKNKLKNTGNLCGNNLHASLAFHSKFPSFGLLFSAIERVSV